MRKSVLNFACVAVVICFSTNLFAQTAGTLTFSFTPVAHSPCYEGSKNVLAVWIQTSAGAFVKTKLRYCCAGNTKDHLPTWAVNSGGTASNAASTACNKTDAITGATLTNFTAKSITWDGKNVNGTVNGTLVADGVYKVTIQSTWNHGTGGTVTKSYTFTKGPNADHQTPANDANFTNVNLDWVPSSTTALTITTTSVNVKCYGSNTGSATATASGTPPYTYSWNTTPVQNTATATGLAAGNYVVTVKDANGTKTATVIITSPTAIVPTVATTNSNCGTANGTASVNASGGTGGYKYLWSNGKTTASIIGLVANAYSVTVTDANGCTATAVANVLNSGAPTATIATTNVTGCFGGTNGSAKVTASGGTGTLTYLWNTSPPQTTSTATGLAAGSYVVTVTDATGCSAKATATISQPAALAINTNVINASSCTVNDGSIASTVLGGTPPYSYLWSNTKNTATITGLSAGNYSLTITDGNGCKQGTMATVSCTGSGGSADAGISSVANPSDSMCGPTFSPVVSLKNFGTTALTSCTILYHVDIDPNQTFNWVGSIAPGASMNVTLPPIKTSAGTHIFTSTSSSPNNLTDANPINDQSQSLFTIKGSTTVIPFEEGFENSLGLPSGWSLDNPDADAAWEISTTVANTGTNCIGFNNCDGSGAGMDMTGTKDRFITNAYDFSNAAASVSLSFDVAYAVLDYKNQLLTDTLAIFASQDCGSTWDQIYLKGGITLATATTTVTQPCWAPTASWNWRTDNINLGNLAGEPSVLFAFENRSDWGEWIYLDNINIHSITGVESLNSLAGFSIYPNPASTSFTLDGVSNAEKIHYTLYNVIGAQVKTGDLRSSGHNFNGKIQVSDIPKGMYFITVSDGKNSWTKKVNIQ